MTWYSERILAGWRAGAQGAPVASGSAPEPSTTLPGVRRLRSPSCWIRLDCPDCHGTGRVPTDPPGFGCAACWQAFRESGNEERPGARVTAPHRAGRHGG